MFNFSPDRDGHRGKNASSALYDLHFQKLKNLKEKVQNSEKEKQLMAGTVYQSNKSHSLRIRAFKKEFTQRLTSLLSSPSAVHPIEHVLDF